ncbi:MAG: glycosyltransferase family 4 protein [Gemmataceae bacterium]
MTSIQSAWPVSGQAKTAGLFLGAISLQPGTGGIARVARLMARVLAEEFAPNELPVRAHTLADGVVSGELGLPVTQSYGSRVRFSLQAMWAIRECQHYLYDGCQLAQVQLIPGLRHKPMLTFIHGIEVWENAKKGYLRSARHATVLLSNSDFTRRKADELHGGFSHARVCWLATEHDAPPPEAPDFDRRPEVLIVARMAEERYKGHRQLIACWPKIVDAVPDARLRIVGSGPDVPAIKALASQSSAAANIVFEGQVSDEELDRLYARASIFAMPSRGEGFGLVYIEAMRHGLPVIASRHDAAPEVVQDGETGFTVDQDHPYELPERIIHLLRNRDVARSLGERGQRHWQEHFRYSAFRTRFRPLLREFLAL